MTSGTNAALLRDGRDDHEKRDAHEKTILIIDDHRSFAELLGRALDTVAGFRCVATASTVAQGLALIGQCSPDVVVMDISMPGEDGLAGTRRIMAVAPTTVVAIVTAYRDPEWVSRAAQAGAAAFIPKNGSLTEMIDILGRVRLGQMLVAPSIFTSQGVDAPSHHEVSRPSLTQRELEVLAYLGQGMHPKGIGTVLGITLGTCRGYLKSLHRKLGVTTQLEAVIKAQHLGLLGPPDER